MSDIKYIVVASTVRSLYDGDLHFIPAKRLIDLYGVDPKQCVTVADGFRSVARAVEKYPNAEILKPLADGEYRGETVAKEEMVKDRAALANLMTKLEGGKSSMIVGDSREYLKKLVHLEKKAILEGKKSVLAMLRKEAVELAEKETLKQAKKKK